jgi:aminoglycoside 6'-N-acetyltransferase
MNENQTTLNLNPMITLRKTTIKDIPILNYWDKQDHVMFASGNDANQSENDPNYWEYELSLCDAKTYQYYIAELDGVPIAYLQMINPGLEVTKYWGDMEDGYRAVDIIIGDKENLGKGYGTTIMRLILDICFKDQTVKGVYIDPLSKNLRAIKFYQKIGFEFVDNRNFDEDNCDVYYISREKYFAPKN